MSSLQENVRNHRRRAGWTQERLAEEADLSLGTVRKVEQGGSVQVETIHMLARALGTTTSSLFASEAPAPVREAEGDGPKLTELRRALMPPIGLSEVLTEPGQAADLHSIQRDIDDSHSLYHADRYDSVAKRLPGILGAFKLLALTPDEKAAAIDEAAPHRLERVALMLGAEGDGLSTHALVAADEWVRIPMAHGVDSLNVGAAAAVAFYAVATGRPGA